MSITQVPFIGRGNELKKISEVIEHSEQSHILCIHGPGGIGKTRLIQETQQKYLKPEHSIIREHIERKNITIAILQESADDEWSREFTIGFRETAQKLNAQVKEFNAEGDIERMVELLKNIISSSPDALIIRNGTNEKVRPLLEQAIKHNIKVLTFENFLQNLPDVTTRVMYEEEEGMHSSLEQLAKDIDYQGELIIAGVKDTIIHERRKKYLEEALQRVFPDISPIKEFSLRQRESTDEDGQDTIAEIKKLLKNYPKAKAFWVTWNKVARWVVRSLLEEKRMDIKVYSFDLSSKDIDYFLVDESPWQATVTNDPRESAAILIRLAIQAVYGHSIKRHYRLSSHMLTQSDIRQHRQDKAYLYGERDTEQIGWTALIQSLYQQKSYSERQIFPLHTIIDFDNPNLLNPVSIGMTLAKQFHSEVFEQFFQAQADYRKMQERGIGQERLRHEEKYLNKILADCVNNVSKQKRLVLFFDTSERLEDTEGFWEDLKDKFSQLENVVIIIAGRNEEMLSQVFQSSQFPYPVDLINLAPLSKEECRTYLQEKQKQLGVQLETELEKHLLILAQGKPILLDLAVEWRVRGISLQWLFEEQIEKWESLSEEKHCQFEKHLLVHFQEMESMIEELILLMAYIFPINTAMIAELFPEEQAEEVFKELKSYVFVKQLPNSYLKLHDEMERMLQEHIWPDIDPDEGRRKWYSQRIVPSFKRDIEKLSQQIDAQRKELTNLEKTDQKTVALALSLELNENEQNLWSFKEQYFTHTLCFDLPAAVIIFDDLFQEATKTLRFDLREKLLKSTLEHYNYLSPEKQAIVDIHLLQSWFDDGRYRDVETRCEEVLKNSGLSVEQTINIYLKRANSRVRSGQLQKSIEDFQQAQKFAEQKDLPIWRIKTTNALGWGYRLQGKFHRAQECYHKARRLCFQQEQGPKNPAIRDDYGWILNNLAFVSSNSSMTRENSINIALGAIEHWKSIRNDFGLAAGYSMLGIAYYRSDKPDPAFEAFNQAEKLFISIHNNEWLGSIYAWRGNLFRIINKLKEAERDLKKALEIGANNIRGMTYCRLGRLYMSKKEWSTAIDYLEKSIQAAKDIPDYLYWLVSIARLIMIAAERRQYNRFGEFEQQLQGFINLLKYEDIEPEQNNLGIAKIGLARLVFSQNNEKEIATIVNLLKEGIYLVTEYGSYANRDGLSRLKIIEQDFNSISPNIIRAVGRQLVDFAIEKELDNIAYSSVTQRMYTWANWKKEEHSHEASSESYY